MRRFALGVACGVLACAGSSIAESQGSGNLPADTGDRADTEVEDEDDGEPTESSTSTGFDPPSTSGPTATGVPTTTSGGSASGSSGSGSTGGTDCAEPLVPPGGACPALCENGCTDDVCRIVCDADNECDGGVACPAGFDCAVVCTGDDACRNTTITCPADGNCSVDCDGAETCEDTTVECGGGVCDLHCSAEPDACQDAALSCGPKACTATCDPDADQPSVACGAACACSPC